MPATRNLELEKKAIEKFTSSTGRTPSSTSDWNQVHLYAYPTIDLLPQEMRNVDTLKLYQSPPVGGSSSITVTTSGANKGVTAGINANIAELTKQRDVASGDMKTLQPQKTAMEAGADTFFNTLQTALKTKAMAGKEGIGQSALFEQAGLTGFDTLQQSLGMRKQEIDTKISDLNNLVLNVGGQWKAAATKIGEAYKDAALRFTTAQDAINKANSDLLDYQKQMDSIRLQASLANKAKQWQIFKEEQKDEDGNTFFTYKRVNEDGTISDVTPSGSPAMTQSIISGEHLYKFDPTTLPKGEELRKNIESIGKLDNEVELQSFIDSNLKNTSITKDDIGKVSNENNMSWETVLGLTRTDPTIKTYKQLNDAAKVLAKTEVYQSPEQLNITKIISSFKNKKGVPVSTPFAKDFKKIVNSEGYDQAITWAKSQFKSYMTGDEKKTVEMAEKNLPVIEKALQILDSADVVVGSGKVKAGYWNRMVQKLMPYLGMNKDEVTNVFNQLASFSSAEKRNQIFGASLTGNEKEASNDFLPDLDKDNIATLKTKLNGLKQIFELQSDRTYSSAMGLPKKEWPFSGKENKMSVDEFDKKIQDLGLNYTYTSPY